MDVSIFLAKALGLYLVVLSIAMLMRPENMTSIVVGIFHNASLQFVLGIHVLMIGILMIISHNIWEASWVTLLTVLAWLIFIKGILYIAFPKTVNAMAQCFIQHRKWLYVSGVIDLALGVYLCYMGFFA